jgi:hypothetical protein
MPYTYASHLRAANFVRVSIVDDRSSRSQNSTREQNIEKSFTVAPEKQQPINQYANKIKQKLQRHGLYLNGVHFNGVYPSWITFQDEKPSHKN